ncbi:ArsR family transcriptional regulator [Candidatus Bathyarchaeota archaeon]|nr:ArsR family transcriptional regulator [Candidatus Bathyarchaeota archaeon]NIU81865.1 ArsR family transcriptional regulator [Candidatus Bathyarchaeota archaeon]NIV68498.1 ArsR family transcriptional regulator [Candidatus Bathyarchaeota archaeon]NIW16793.1 ArsR family transcriptional regulator [Candidatus Bathyarchaeota archaeon]
MKRAYHPKAFLSLKRNIRPGLVARTQILSQLEEDRLSAKAIAQKTDLSYAATLYHLHLLEAENILLCKGKRPYLWELTGAGQQRLR